MTMASALGAPKHLVWLTAGLSASAVTACGGGGTANRTPVTNRATVVNSLEECDPNDPEKTASNPKCENDESKKATAVVMTTAESLSTVAGSTTTVELRISEPKDTKIREIQFSEANLNKKFKVLFVDVFENTAVFCVFIPHEVPPGDYKVNFIALGNKQGGKGVGFTAAGQYAQLQLTVREGADTGLTLSESCPNSREKPKTVLK